MTVLSADDWQPNKDAALMQLMRLVHSEPSHTEEQNSSNANDYINVPHHGDKTVAVKSRKLTSMSRTRCWRTSRVKTACDRDDCVFMLVLAVVRDRVPALSICSVYNM